MHNLSTSLHMDVQNVTRDDISLKTHNIIGIIHISTLGNTQ